ncbi:hypothetical protein B0A49_00545 [Cryomyces minteri]|uniref:Uncharacterized protein n=1 Tax=Cryomyces minteri TaxID=331657 RepID=A0A4U0Y0J7_9PEZI|nr:hypothetical protein B0A49_02395 [Cryomyces minteri]TKA81493.1 hypothetical protein B0A49_00545 [Cryomyces minteri]
MASNKIVTSKLLASISKGGQQLELRAATATSFWTRPEVGIEALTPGLIKAVESSDKSLPAETAKFFARPREADHASQNDPKDHYTVVLQDKNGNYIRTEHFEKNAVAYYNTIAIGGHKNIDDQPDAFVYMPGDNYFEREGSSTVCVNFASGVKFSSNNESNAQSQGLGTVVGSADNTFGDWKVFKDDGRFLVVNGDGLTCNVMYSVN